MKRNRGYLKNIVFLPLFAVAALFPASAMAEEGFKDEIAELRAKIAQQDDELKKFKAEQMKVEDPRSLTSIKKNTKVSVGGRLRTRYYNRNADFDRVDPTQFNKNPNLAPMTQQATNHTGDLMVKDAKINIAVEKENFGAYFRIDLQSSGRVTGGKINSWGGSDNAEQAYMYWKNICDTGFGVLIGRDALKFGQGDNPGVLGTYVSNNGEGIGDVPHSAFKSFASYADDASVSGGKYSFSRSPIAPHNTWDISRVTQITPYWEGLDGKIRLEASIMQYDGSVIETTEADGFSKYAKSNDFGTSFATRGIFKPIDGMMITAGLLALHKSYVDKINHPTEYSHPRLGHSSYNYATDLAFSYRPENLKAVKFWAEWIHGWNVENIKDLDSDALNVGISYDFLKRFTFFLQGDYLKVRQDDALWNWKSEAWAAYTGLQMKLSHGVMAELGWKHEWVDDYVNGWRTSKGRGDTIYGHIGFDF